MLNELSPTWKAVILASLALLLIFGLVPLYIWITAIFVFDQQHFDYLQALILTIPIIVVIAIVYDTRGK